MRHVNYTNQSNYMQMHYSFVLARIRKTMPNSLVSCRYFALPHYPHFSLGNDQDRRGRRSVQKLSIRITQCCQQLSTNIYKWKNDETQISIRNNCPTGDPYKSTTDIIRDWCRIEYEVSGHLLKSIRYQTKHRPTYIWSMQNAWKCERNCLKYDYRLQIIDCNTKDQELLCTFLIEIPHKECNARA